MISQQCDNSQQFSLYICSPLLFYILPKDNLFCCNNQANGFSRYRSGNEKLCEISLQSNQQSENMKLCTVLFFSNFLPRLSTDRFAAVLVRTHCSLTLKRSGRNVSRWAQKLLLSYYLMLYERNLHLHCAGAMLLLRSSTVANMPSSTSAPRRQAMDRHKQQHRHCVHQQCRSSSGQVRPRGMPGA